jgi:iron complex outermembrane recepter protein
MPSFFVFLQAPCTNRIFLTNIMKKYTMNFKQTFCCICLSMIGTMAFAQRTLQGKVTNVNNEPLIDATILVKGTLIGTTTNADGRYNIYVPSGAATLIFSFTGYVSQEVNIGQKTVLNVTLSEGLELDNIVVVGSRNATRTKLETPVPVDIIPVSVVVNEVGQVDLNQILNYAAPSFQSNRQTVADGTDHIDPAQLRGLGPDQVLVLVNGKRRHTSSLVNINGTIGRGSVGTDLSAIPIAAIERVEILRDGAAAQYGSDAIAGVINIVLKKDAELVHANLATGINTAGDGAVTNLGLNYGFKLLDKGFFNISGDFNQRGATNRTSDYTGPIFKSAPSELVYQNEKVPELGNRTRMQADNDTLSKLGLTRKDFRMRVGNSQIRSMGVFFNAVYPLSINAEVYAFGGYNFKQGTAAGFYRLPNDTRVVKDIYPIGYLPEIHSVISDKAATLGVKGSLRGWNLDFANTYGQNQFLFQVENSLNASLLAASPTSFQCGGFSFAQNTTNFDVNRLFGNIQSGMNVAFGGEFRTENYQIIAGEEASYRNYGVVAAPDTLRNASGEITAIVPSTTRTLDRLGRPGGAQVFPGFRPENAVNRYRTNASAYLDVELDATDKWLIEGALRAESYSDFGATANIKAASRYKISTDLAVRGAISTGFRAPALQQRYFNNTSTQFDNRGIPSEIGTFSNDSRIARLLGIPKLKQETSRNLSLGITSRLTRQFDISADIYHIQIQNRIILTGQFEGGNIADILKSANASKAAFFTNAVDTRTTGLDIVADYNAKIPEGSVKVVLAANFNRNEVVKNGDGTPLIHATESLKNYLTTYFNREDQSRLETATPNMKVNLTVNFRQGKWSAMVRNVYFGSVQYVFPAATETDASKWVINTYSGKAESRDQTFGGKVVTDFSVARQLTTQMSFTLGANNVFNIYPDAQTHSENVSYGRFLYSRRVQQFGFNGAYWFGRFVVHIR